MRRNYRRGSRGVWFPTENLEADIVSFGGAPTLDAVALVGGNADEPTNTTAWPGGFSLVSATTQGYIVKRIVGSFFCGNATGEAYATNAASTKVFAGIFTDRVDTTGNLGAGAINAWNPFIEGSSQKRWMWRREWLFGNKNGIAHRGLDASELPANNTAYGSIREGTHVDVKVAARVSYEERLWLYVAVAPANGGGEQVNAWYRANLRIFGKSVQVGNR